MLVESADLGFSKAIMLCLHPDALFIFFRFFSFSGFQRFRKMQEAGMNKIGMHQKRILKVPISIGILINVHQLQGGPPIYDYSYKGS